MTDSDDIATDNGAAAASPPDVPAGVGPQLRAAREARGLTLDQVAAQTRISRRQLELIEAGEFDALAGRTYAVGFARTLARLVGLDEGDVVAMVRAEMAAMAKEGGNGSMQRGTFEPGDPARAPTGGLLWFSLAAVVILLVGIFFTARALFSPAAELPSLVEQQQAEVAEAASEVAAETPPDPAGAVVFTAEGETWVRFYDGDGHVLQEGTMAAGQSFTVPADANNPQLMTGRPNLLAITVGGRPVAKLSNTVETVQDVPISAAALLARNEPASADGAEPVAERGPTLGFSLAAPAAPRPVPSAAARRTAAPPVQAAASAAAEPGSPPAEPPSASPGPAATAPPRAIEAQSDGDGASPIIN